jgi:electron transfer DM13
MTKRNVIVAAAALVLVAVWYAFRPERLFLDQRVNEATGGSGAAVAAGAFHGVSHDGKGTATIVRRPDGSRVLELTGFETSNGPDLQLYLVAARDANDAASVKTAGFVTLGALKGNVGNQVYPVPADLDLDRYRAVTVWCRRFGVNFATAPLDVPPATASR